MTGLVGRLSAALRSRKSVGIALLLLVVFLWVSSNFLTYAIYADNSYSKPYFVTYVNTATFSLYLLPWAIRCAWKKWRGRSVSDDSAYARVANDMEGADAGVVKEFMPDRLDTWQTFKLSGEFCLIWFIANYFSGASFQFTSVASGSILSSTSSIFTLLLAAALGVERFTFAKLLTVLLSLFGIGLISSTDLDSGPDEEYPRTPKQYMIGDAMALLGALAYAIYTTVMKVRVGSEDRVDMQQFFGFVGVINAVCLWPGLLFLDWMKWETFEAPPDERVWLIVISNAVITLVSDFAWAHAMLYTTPLLVTVGLSLTIPLSLLGQVVFFDKDLTFTYAIGAAMVFIAFWGINKEEEPDIVAMEASRRASLIGPSIVASQPEDDLDIFVPGPSGSE